MIETPALLSLSLSLLISISISMSISASALWDREDLRRVVSLHNPSYRLFSGCRLLGACQPSRTVL